MNSIELINLLLPKTDIDVDLHNSTDKNEIVQVEIADGVFVDIKEIYFIANPNRTVIRLEDLAYDGTNKTVKQFLGLDLIKE